MVHIRSKLSSLWERSLTRCFHGPITRDDLALARHCWRPNGGKARVPGNSGLSKWSALTQPFPCATAVLASSRSPHALRGAAQHRRILFFVTRPLPVLVVPSNSFHLNFPTTTFFPPFVWISPFTLALATCVPTYFHLVVFIELGFALCALIDMSRLNRGNAPPPAAAAARQNEYFVPRDGIDREVITADICRYLGNDALVRPGTYEVCFDYVCNLKITVVLDAHITPA